MADPVRLDAHAESLELAELLPVDGPVDDAVGGEVLLVRQRLPVADVGERHELHRRIAVLVQHGRGILEVVAVAVVEGDQHGALGQRRPVGVVREHGVEADDRVAELPQLCHLLVEERHRHRHPVSRQVVDLVVHEHPQAAIVAVHDADALRGLADRPVDRVLQQLLDLLAHGGRLAV